MAHTVYDEVALECEGHQQSMCFPAAIKSIHPPVKSAARKQQTSPNIMILGAEGSTREDPQLEDQSEEEKS